jgi:hypothetical protein
MPSTKGRPTDARHEACALSSYALYGGAVDVRFVGGAKHDYFVTDPVAALDDSRTANVTDVTKVLDKPGLTWWRIDMCLKHLEDGFRPGLDEVSMRRLLDAARSAPDKYTNEARYVGSAMHRWIEEGIGRAIETGIPVGAQGSTLPANERVRAGIEAFLEWEAEAKPKYLASERKVYSREHRYVGTLDTLLELGGRRHVLDVKSSNKVSIEHFAQVAGYAIAAQEEDGEEIHGGIVLHLPKVPKKKAKAYPCVDFEADKEMFLSLRKVYLRIYKR